MKICGTLCRTLVVITFSHHTYWRFYGINFEGRIKKELNIILKRPLKTIMTWALQELVFEEEHPLCYFTMKERLLRIILTDSLLVKKLELMRKNVLGDGQTTCLICGAKAGFKDSLRICLKCDKVFHTNFFLYFVFCLMF